MFAIEENIHCQVLSRSCSRPESSRHEKQAVDRPSAGFMSHFASSLIAKPYSPSQQVLVKWVTYSSTSGLAADTAGMKTVAMKSVQTKTNNTWINFG